MQKELVEKESQAIDFNGHTEMTSSNASNAEAPLDWKTYLEIFIHWKKFILVTTLSALIISGIISLILPVWYLATSTILIQQQSDLLGISKLLGGAGGLADGLLGKSKLSDDVDRYEAIFKSERLRLAVIEKFNLRKIYEFDEEDTREPIKKTLKALAEDIGFKDNKDGTITISAYYKEDSLKAAEMTNYIVMMLDSINVQLGTESAKNQRVFIEKRYYQAISDLYDSEERLKEFQKKYKVAEVKDQVKASLDASAQIEAASIQSEVEFNVLRRSLGENNPQVIQAKNKLDELRKQSKKFEIGGLASDLIIPFERMPDVGMDYLRLYRNVMLQQKILEFLVPQYEQAKIQEAKDTPTILVLDKARVPEWKEKPKRLTIILLSTLGAFGLTIVFVFCYHFFTLFKETNSALYKMIISIFKF